MNSIQGSIGSKASTKASCSESQKEELEASIRECAASEVAIAIPWQQHPTRFFDVERIKILAELQQQHDHGVRSLDAASKLENLAEELSPSQHISQAVDAYFLAYVQYRDLDHAKSAFRCLW